MNEPELKIVQYVVLGEADLKTAAQEYVRKHAELNYYQDTGEATFNADGPLMRVEIIKKVL